MKKFLFLFAACALFAACGGEETKESKPTIKAQVVEDVISIPAKELILSYDTKDTSLGEGIKMRYVSKVQASGLQATDANLIVMELVDAQGFALATLYCRDIPAPNKKVTLEFTSNYSWKGDLFGDKDRIFNSAVGANFSLLKEEK